jgi:hypothetical protein
MKSKISLKLFPSSARLKIVPSKLPKHLLLSCKHEVQKCTFLAIERNSDSATAKFLCKCLISFVSVKIDCKKMLARAFETSKRKNKHRFRVEYIYKVVPGLMPGQVGSFNWFPEWNGLKRMSSKLNQTYRKYRRRSTIPASCHIPLKQEKNIS